MFKKILGNSHGMSLMETVVASAISIVIAMGVMQINQNANKGMADIQRKANIRDFQNVIKMKISRINEDGSRACTNIFSNAIHGNPATPWDASNPGVIAGDFIATTESGGSIPATAEPDFTVGEELPGFPGSYVKAARVLAFDNGTGDSVQGRCDLEIEFASRDALNRANGVIGNADSRFVIIPILCTVDDITTKVVQSCSATSSGDFGDDSACSVVANTDGEIIDCNAVGKPRMNVGTVPSDSDIAVLNLFPDGSGVQNSAISAVYGGNPMAAINLPSDSAITWGENESSTDPLGIYANDTNKTIYVTHSLEVGEVIKAGNSVEAPNMYSNNYYYFSDKNYKKDIQDLGYVSDKLEDLRGVTYFMRRDEFPDMNFDSNKHIGLIAQEVEAVFPELVTINPSTGYKSVQYGNFVAILLEAVKEQKAEIERNREMLAYIEAGSSLKDSEQDARIEALEQENRELREQLDEVNRKLDLLLYREE